VKQPSKKALLDFVRQIARMTKDGDILENHDGSEYEYSADGNDEEIDAFYSLISQARALTATKVKVAQ